MKMKDLYELIDGPVLMRDNDGCEYTFKECANMEVVSIHSIDSGWILCIVDKCSLCD